MNKGCIEKCESQFKQLYLSHTVKHFFHFYPFNTKGSMSMCPGCLHQESEHADVSSSTMVFVQIK